MSEAIGRHPARRSARLHAQKNSSQTHQWWICRIQRTWSVQLAILLLELSVLACSSCGFSGRTRRRSMRTFFYSEEDEGRGQEEVFGLVLSFVSGRMTVADDAGRIPGRGPEVFLGNLLPARRGGQLSSGIQDGLQSSRH